MTTRTLPVLTSDRGLSHYMEEIKKFPMLSADEEFMLGKRYAEHDDTEAAHKLVTSHLRLVAKIAMGYRFYGLPVTDLISEGNVGLMRAVKKFDPDRGFRLATYAMWWIKAAINEYVLSSWSMVKMGTVAAQKKLFFNLRRMKANLGAYEEGDLDADTTRQIAEKLGVDEAEVIDMNRRLAGSDVSLDAPLSDDSDMGRIDYLVDEGMNPEQAFEASESEAYGSDLLGTALESLNERERYIIEQRRLLDEPRTLEDIGEEYGISRERVRQIESRAFEKLQKAAKNIALKREMDAADAVEAGVGAVA